MLYLLAPGAIPVIGLLCFTPFLSAYWKEVIISTAVYALLAISWDMLMGAGLLSLGQSLFFGVGSYLAGVLNHYWGVSPLFTIPIATLVGGALCMFILLPVLRLRGIYFAMVTLVLPLMFGRLVEATRIPGGTEGLTGLTPISQSDDGSLPHRDCPFVRPVRLSKNHGIRLRPGYQSHQRQ